MNMPVAIELYKLTKEQACLDALTANVNYWKKDIQTTKGGLKYLNSWGVLRYSAAASFICMEHYKLTGDTSSKALAVKQVNYILGDNPAKISYMIGYGNSYPTHPHHRAANGRNLLKAKYVLTGGLVGGPNQNDMYLDKGDAYQYTEVGIDYNAGLVAALSSLMK